MRATSIIFTLSSMLYGCGTESDDKELGFCRIYNGYDDQTILIIEHVTLKECRDRAYSMDGGNYWIFFSWDPD